MKFSSKYSRLSWSSVFRGGKLRRHSAILLGVQILYKVSGVLLLMIVSRQLSASSIGLFFFATAFAESFLLLANFSLNMILMRRVSEDPAHASAHLAPMLGFRLVSGPVYLVCVCLAAFVFSHAAWQLIALISVFTLLEDVYFVFVSLFMAVEKVAYIAWIGITVEVLYLVLFVFGMHRHPSLGVLVWANMLRSAALVIAALWMTRRWVCKLRVTWDNRLIRSGTPFLLLAFLGILHGKLGIILLGRLGNYSDVGHFQLALSLALAAVFAPAAIGSALLPRLSAQGLSAANRTSIVRAGTFIAILGVVAMAVSFFFAGPLTWVLYGVQSREVAPLLRALSPFFLLNFMASYFSMALQALRRESDVLRSVIVVATVSIVAYIGLIPPFGANGAVFAQDLSAMVQACIFGLRLRQLFKQPIEATSAVFAPASSR